jgi:hypothetical protein
VWIDDGKWNGCENRRDGRWQSIDSRVSFFLWSFFFIIITLWRRRSAASTFFYAHVTIGEIIIKEEEEDGGFEWLMKEGTKRRTIVWFLASAGSTCGISCLLYFLQRVCFIVCVCVCYCELIFFFCFALLCPLGVIIGRPRPEVTWWLDERLLDQTFVATSESVVQNVLVIGQLERRHLHANLRCQASNAAAITGYNSSSSSSSSSSSTAQTTSLHILRHHQQQQQHYQLHTLVSSVQLDLNRKWGETHSL